MLDWSQGDNSLIVATVLARPRSIIGTLQIPLREEEINFTISLPVLYILLRVNKCKL